jgi:glycosyltransferase involved in cell wall biosynthesis
MDRVGLPAATIAIPTYNGAARIIDVLGALALQDARADTFEVVVIDNNSTDGTSERVQSDPSWEALRQRGVERRIVSEKRQGLAFGRIRGVQSARGKYVCFLDDDTVPNASYVRNGVAALDADSSIGILVSRLSPRYERNLTAAFAKREHLLAINQRHGNERIDFGAEPTMAPTIGGGLWVVRSAFLSCVPWETPSTMLPDRIGNRLVSGNDIEIGFLFGRAGYRRVYCPELGLEHRIPANRLRTRYFARLIDGIVRSHLTLDDRYGVTEYTFGSRLKAVGRLSSALIALPALLAQPDGLRESIFVLASRVAWVRGPFRFKVE